MVVPSGGTLYGDNVIPSYIAFNQQGELIAYGLAARERFFNGSNAFVFRHIKRLIGRTYDYVAERISKNHAPFLEFKDCIKRREDGFISLQMGSTELSVTQVMSYLIKKIYD